MNEATNLTSPCGTSSPPYILLSKDDESFDSVRNQSFRVYVRIFLVLLENEMISLKFVSRTKKQNAKFIFEKLVEHLK